MTFVTDRTAQDVYERTEKGIYTGADLDRVERAVEDLCRQLKTVGISLELQVHTTWQQDRSIPTREEMHRYLENIHRIEEVLQLNFSLPSTMDVLDFEGANRIEMALMRAYQKIRALQGGE